MYILKKKLKILIFLLLIIFVLYGLYLYHKIHKLISGSVWIFPTEIYSRIINFEPGSLCSKRQMSSLLAQSMYQKVHHVMLPGEYRLSKNSIQSILFFSNSCIQYFFLLAKPISINTPTIFRTI